MIWFWRLLTMLFVLSIPLWFGPVILADLAHPERWDSDWMHDARMYLPMIALVVIAGLAMAIHVYLTERRKR